MLLVKNNYSYFSYYNSFLKEILGKNLFFHINDVNYLFKFFGYSHKYKQLIFLIFVIITTSDNKKSLKVFLKNNGNENVNIQTEEIT